MSVRTLSSSACRNWICCCCDKEYCKIEIPVTSFAAEHSEKKLVRPFTLVLAQISYDSLLFSPHHRTSLINYNRNHSNEFVFQSHRFQFLSSHTESLPLTLNNRQQRSIATDKSWRKKNCFFIFENRKPLLKRGGISLDRISNPKRAHESQRENLNGKKRKQKRLSEISH